MYFHTTYDSNDCDGHADFLQHLLVTIQNRSMRTKARSCDSRFVYKELDIFTHPAKRARYDDAVPPSTARTPTAHAQQLNTTQDARQIAISSLKKWRGSWRTFKQDPSMQGSENRGAHV